MNTYQKGFLNIALGVFGVLLFMTLGYWILNRYENTKKIKENIVVISQESPSLASYKEITFEELEENIKLYSLVPYTNIDTTGWADYNNSYIGLKFKYPLEWGQPFAKLTPYADCIDGQVCGSRDKKAALSLLITFPNSKFLISANSANYWPPRGQNILGDYAGGVTQNAGSTFCTDKWFTSCAITTNTVKYTSAGACAGEHYTGLSGWETVMLIDKPKNNLAGWAFGGPFIPEVSSNLAIFDLQISCDDRKLLIIKEALRNRTMPKDVMLNYDVYNAVFETVEVN